MVSLLPPCLAQGRESLVARGIISSYAWRRHYLLCGYLRAVLVSLEEGKCQGSKCCKIYHRIAWCHKQEHSGFYSSAFN